MAWVMETDYSMHNWGAVCDGIQIRVLWSQAEHQSHINHLELVHEGVHKSQNSLLTLADGQQNSTM